MIVVFLGPPGCGKGTQADLVCRARTWRHVSTGELLRSAVERETAIGRQAKDYMDRGNLVPDDIILGLIGEVLGNGTSGVVLDGFPRTLSQSEGLDGLLGRIGRGVDRAVYFTADDKEVMRRMLARGRADDTPETVRHRLTVYEEITAPLIEHYRVRGLLREVNGVGGIEEIHDRVTAALA